MEFDINHFSNDDEANHNFDQVDQVDDCKINLKLSNDAINYNTMNRGIITIHLIEPDVGMRASVARRLVKEGFHAEIYAGYDEFVAFAPKDGVILINDAGHPAGLTGMIGHLGALGALLPILVYCDNPTIHGAVSAMKASAVDYFSRDVSDAALAVSLRVAYSNGEKARAHQDQVYTYVNLINRLSPRERQVLKLLVEGESNKGVARVLGLSPRTVEIHRMKMMGKIGAKSLTQVVRMWCAADLTA